MPVAAAFPPGPSFVLLAAKQPPQSRGVSGFPTHLSHHRTCGPRIRRFARSFEADPMQRENETFLHPMVIGQSTLKDGRPRDPPVTAATQAPLIGQIRPDPKASQIRDTGSREFPFLPPDLAHPRPEPFIQGRRTSSVSVTAGSSPSIPDIAVQLLDTDDHGDTPFFPADKHLSSL